ncbi:MAG: hypothetical protein NTV32_05735 [Gammaproteobacteria bacterium]|jgi:hypothetical protein|nr:hypothetical protein [Gammaproteobacteria bacterium]
MSSGRVETKGGEYELVARLADSVTLYFQVKKESETKSEADLAKSLRLLQKIEPSAIGDLRPRYYSNPESVLSNARVSRMSIQIKREALVKVPGKDEAFTAILSAPGAEPNFAHIKPALQVTPGVVTTLTYSAAAKAAGGSPAP